MTKIIKMIIILILTSFFIYFLKPKNQENFITWYLPFYNKGTVELTSGTPKYITSNLEYNYLEYDYINEIKMHILQKTQYGVTEAYYKFLFSNIVKSLKVKKLLIFQVDNTKDLLKNVNDTKYNLAIVSAPTLVKKLSTDVDSIKNVNVVIVSNYRFIFFITNKLAQISKLSEINGKRINLGQEDSDDWLFGTGIIQNLKINYDIEISPSFDDPKTAFDKLLRFEIDGMFFTDLYPSEILNKIIEQDLTKLIVLVPMDDLNKDAFRQRHTFAEPVSIDLNALPDNYLPVKVKELEYNKFRPDYNTYRYPDFIICNKNAEPRNTFGIVKSFVSNLEILNNSEFFKQNGYNYLTFPNIANSGFLPIHIGAKIFYNHISINTVMPNDMCKFFIGNAKCNDERIEGAKIVMGLDGATEF